jgi:hypothetical protein
MCCNAVNACMADSACKATVNCQYNCYNTMTGTAADTCAQACPGTTAALFTAYDACNGTTCMTPCACP